MIQAVIKGGKVVPETVPVPAVSDGAVLISVVNSCISAGTEISGVRNSGKTLMQRVMEKPDRVIKALEVLKNEGPAGLHARIKGQDPGTMPTGYSVAGTVIAVGNGVSRFRVGDRVAAAGAGRANHAECVDVPENLVVRTPDAVTAAHASTVALGAIAMQGVRRADLNLGEYGVVVGAGILGLLTIQMLKASGVRTIALDIDDSRLGVATALGSDLVINVLAEDPVGKVINHTGGFGADAVIFTAATDASEPLSQAFRLCRKKGRVILVGVSGMEINREDMYEKELELHISTSYGPGRYDSRYEVDGLDYPYAYVRWTENRNMEEYLRLLERGAVSLEKIISAEYPIEEVTSAFESFATVPKPLIVLLRYSFEEALHKHALHDLSRVTLRQSLPRRDELVNVALVGTGSFAMAMHLPILQKLSSRYRLHCVMGRNGLKAKEVAAKFGAVYATTSFEDLLADNDVDLVLISTRHDSHADYTLQALQQGKHVFVEKPLATNIDDLNRIRNYYAAGNRTDGHPLLMVGFNRRFSRYAREIKKQLVGRVGPLYIRYRMNAGFAPAESWVHADGGRIIGEACHIIDLMSFITGSSIAAASHTSPQFNGCKYSDRDNRSITLNFADGSLCLIDYLSVGNAGFPKEYMEIHFDEKTIVLDDYKSLKGYGLAMTEIATRQSDKGHLEEFEALYDALKGGGCLPIPLDSIFRTTEVSIGVSGN